MKTVWIIVGVLAVAGAGVGIYFLVKKAKEDKEAANLKAAGYVPVSSGVDKTAVLNTVASTDVPTTELNIARKLRSKETYTDSKGNVWMRGN